MTCTHEISGSREKEWLEYYYQGRCRGLKPHPYCSKCGLIRNLSSERRRTTGFYMNIIHELERYYKIAQVQIRQIALEMERQQIEDAFGMSRTQQDELFIQIVTKTLRIPERDLRMLLDL